MEPEEPEAPGATIIFTRSTPPPAAAERDDVGDYLVMVEGGEPGRRILLGSAPLTIGRDAARDLVLADSNVSRLHAQVSPQQGKVLVEDRNSTNGTFVDGKRVQTAVLAEGSLLQVGAHVLRFERRSKREVARTEELARDLAKASQYLLSLLPPPLVTGRVRTDWSFHPSAQLGGDAFGYDQLDADTFVVYLIDVSGHGVGAAMHSVSVLNVLRQRALPDTDVRDPAQVLAGLNAMFQMDRHDGMFFTMWYGVYQQEARTLRYGCAGHHPGYLVSAERDGVVALKTPGLMIGAMADARFRADEVVVPPGSRLYVFSDGVFEVVTRDERQWRLRDFVPLLTEAGPPGTTESDRLHQAVRAVARPGPLDDDFSLLVVTFP
jgi:serine phosphatase RsbU (regulator of sigma subunit)